MAVSPLRILRENARQDLTSDFSFYQKFVYFFELRVPQSVAGVGGSRSFIFPLMINPQSYSMTEPFALTSEKTQGGGLYTEENGIIERKINLEGTTGFKPRSLINASAVSLLGKAWPEKKSYSRALLPFVLDKLSGQRHFHYLQDAVFRTYGDLKRDPATSEETEMIFHNPKDDEHWLVKPEMFKLSRSSDDPVSYKYNIELLVVDKAEAVDADFSEDKALIDAIKDALRMVKSGLDMAAGALNDLTALADEITRLIKDFGKLVDGVSDILNAASDFVDGVNAVIAAPYSLINSVNELADAALELMDARIRLEPDATVTPPYVFSKMRQMQDGINRIGTHPEAFETPSQRALREIKERQELNTLLSTSTLDSALATPPPATLDEIQNLGTAPTAGDVRTAQAELGVGRNVTNYTGAKVVNVGQGDTLVNLAARYLGDATLWQQIAVINGLKPPYTSSDASRDLFLDEDPLPGAIVIGDQILIPDFSKSLQRQPLLPVLGVTNEAPLEDQVLGSDWELKLVGGSLSKPVYDLVVDTDRGSTDAKIVRGIANVVQAIRMRLTIEKGTDTLYRRLGLDRIIGFNILPVDLETVRFRIKEAIEQDPRVVGMFRIQLDSDGTDTVVVDGDVALRGISESSKVRLAV